MSRGHTENRDCFFLLSLPEMAARLLHSSSCKPVATNKPSASSCTSGVKLSSRRQSAPSFFHVSGQPLLQLVKAPARVRVERLERGLVRLLSWWAVICKALPSSTSEQSPKKARTCLRKAERRGGCTARGRSHSENPSRGRGRGRSRPPKPLRQDGVSMSFGQ